MPVVLMFTFALIGCGDADEDATAGITQPPGDGGKADGFFDGLVAGVEDLFDGDEIPTDPDDLRVWEGDVTEDNIYLLKPYHVINGRVNIINRDSAAEVSLPNLVEVNGQMLIEQCDSLERIDLPQLRRVNGPVRITWNPKLNEIYLPKLETVGNGIDAEDSFLEDAFVMRRNVSLNDLDIGQLRHVTGSFVIDGNGLNGSVAFLSEINVPQLETVGKTLLIKSLPWTVELLLPQLRTVGHDLEIRSNDVLGSIKLPRLETIGDTFSVTYNDVAENILFPVLTEIGGDWFIRNNDDLTTILMPELENAPGEVTIDASINTCDLGSYTEAYCY